MIDLAQGWKKSRYRIQEAHVGCHDLDAPRKGSEMEGERHISNLLWKVHQVQEEVLVRGILLQVLLEYGKPLLRLERLLVKLGQDVA